MAGFRLEIFVKLPDKETLDRLKDLASLAQKAILAVGVWILFCYCLSERIMPDGLSLGDAMILIMIALGFGVVMTLGVWYGMIAALAPAKLILAVGNAITKGKRSSFTAFWRDKVMTLISVVFLFLLGVLVLIGMTTGSTSDMKLGQTVGCFVTIGLLLLWLFAVKYEDKKPRSLTWTLVLCALAIVTPVVVFHPAVMDITMAGFGIRSAPGSLIVIDAADYPKIEEVMIQSGLNAHFCRLSKSGNWATTDARVVWHGVGITSFVSFRDSSSAGKHTISIPVPKASLQVIRPEHWTFDCDKTLSGKAATP